MPTAAQTALSVTPTAAEPSALRLWIPPQFDPANGSQASNLLQARLEEFSRKSGVRLEVRVKSDSGPGGLVDSLSATNAAAPLALPDLILLPRSQLETAALKGLVYPFDGLIDPLDKDDWYPYALQLAQLQKSTFGLPFAGDGQVLLSRPAEINNPPSDWQNALELGEPLIFPADDEQALFTLAQYLSAGGQIEDADGRPILEPAPLTKVLSFYQQAETAGVMPFWITQFGTDDQAWKSFAENSSNQLVTWASRYLNELPGDTTATTIPTSDSQPLTLTNGWVWALSNQRTERHALSVQLAEYLTAADFLGRWTQSAGYLPPRKSVLAGWTDTSLRNLVGKIVQSAQIIPPNDVMAVIGPALQKATVEVLTEQTDPASAARQAIDSLGNPK